MLLKRMQRLAVFSVFSYYQLYQHFFGPCLLYFFEWLLVNCKSLVHFAEIIRAYTDELPMKPAPPVMSTLRITWTMGMFPLNILIGYLTHD
jgi:hypothetical protein